MGMVRGLSALEYNNGHPASVISYIGGKSALIGSITPIISYCAQAYGLKGYYEMCGGGARMLLSLPPALFAYRSYNEMDLGLCKLFACLGSKEFLYDLMALLEELGCGEDAFLQAKHAREFEKCMLAQGRADCELGMVEGAAYAFIVAMQSRAADCETFDSSRVTDRKRLRSYFKRVRELDLFYPTLAGVEVTLGDCRELLDLLRGRDDAFAYLDPPYTPKEMVLSDHYGDRSWTFGDHERLVDRLLTANMKVALSGYANECYARLEAAGWRRLYLKRVHVSSAATGRWNDEYLWINFECQRKVPSATSVVDSTFYFLP
jgi:site-specific DNA-adenine methylase